MSMFPKILGLFALLTTLLVLNLALSRDRGELVTRTYVYDRDVGLGVSASVFVEHAEGVDLQSAVLTVRTRPLRATVNVAPAYGDARHWHNIIFALSDDTQTPRGLALVVDGLDITREVGGPFAPAGGMLTLVLEVAPRLQAAGYHHIELTTTSGQGHVEIQIEISERKK